MSLNVVNPFKGKAPPFSPISVPGINLWLNAAEGITPVAGIVSNWADQSGIGNDVTQVTSANRPQHVVSDPNFNNLPSVQFDGINDFMEKLEFIVPWTDEFRIYFVSNGDVGNLKMFMDGVASNRTLIGIGGAGDDKYFTFSDGITLTNNVVATPGSPVLHRVTFSPTGGWTRNGVTVVSGDSGDSGMTGIHIASDDVNGANGLLNLAELAIYDNVPSSENDTLLIDYFNTKYAI